MESAYLDDQTREMYIKEYLDPDTNESQRKALSKEIVKDILKRYRKLLLERSGRGENLSDRELSILTFTGEVDENLREKMVERKISEHVSEKYVEEYVLTRVKKQTALQLTKELANVPILIAKSGVLAIKASSTIGGISSIFAQAFSASVFVINFGITGAFFMLEILHSYYLLRKKEITGKEFAKRVTSSLASNGLGVAGASLGWVIGAAIGAPAGGVGLVVGSVIGGFIGGLSFSLIGTWINEKLWRLFNKGETEEAQEELVKEARKTLGVCELDDFTRITDKWRTLVLHYHPDKNPNACEEEKKGFGLKFQELHSAYIILREEAKKKLPLSEVQKISKSSAIHVMNDGWAHDDTV